MSAIHAQDVENPKRDYPKALLYSTIIILISLILSSLAVAVVVPAKQLSLVSGLLEAYYIFFNAFGLYWLMPLIAVLIIIGAIGGIGAWVIGPSKGMLVAAQDGCISPKFGKTNKYYAPVKVLLLQGIIFSVICLVYLIMPSVNSSFWVLSDLTAQLALLSYIFMFAAAIRLRYKFPNVQRNYKIPCGNFGMWIVGIAGIIASVFTVVIGFFPPAQINIGSIITYEVILVGGMLVICTAPLIIYYLNSRVAK